MQKLLIISTLSLWINFIHACDCTMLSPEFESLDCKYVFVGTIISKKYSPDKSTFIATFAIETHYKTGDNPHVISFSLESEPEFSTSWSSCSFYANIGEKWLVFVRDFQGTLSFSKMCSNSRTLGQMPLSKFEIQFYENLKRFNAQNYIYHFTFGLTKAIDINNKILSEKLAKIESTNIKKPFIFGLHIDSNGKLIEIGKMSNLDIRQDSIFKLINSVKVLQNVPDTPIEKKIIKQIRKMKLWGIKYVSLKMIAVSHVNQIIVYNDPNTKKLTYRLLF